MVSMVGNVFCRNKADDVFAGGADIGKLVIAEQLQPAAGLVALPPMDQAINVGTGHIDLLGGHATTAEKRGVAVIHFWCYIH